MAGTSTGVGKTRVAAALAARWAPDVAVRKPAQSYDGPPTDAEILAAASGEPVDAVCPPHRSYELGVAPFMAAVRLGRPPFTLDDLVGELRWPAVRIGLVESAGGVRSPITSDAADTVDLCDALAPDRVVLVAAAGLGTLNAVRLAVDVLARHPTTVFLNRYEPADRLHVDNRAWLVEHLDVPVCTELDQLTA